jgi:hypothetical protein
MKLKLKTKKILAREFLILISIIILSVILYLGTFLYNLNINYQANKIEKKIMSKNQNIDSLRYSYDFKINKQKWFFEENAKKYDIYDFEYNTYEKFWDRLSTIQKNDSLIYRWNNVYSKKLKEIFKEIGLKDGYELNEFIIKNSVTLQDLENKKIADSLKIDVNKFKNKKIDVSKKKLKPSEQFNFFISCLSILVIIMFPIRFLIIAIKWCYLILKIE